MSRGDWIEELTSNAQKPWMEYCEMKIIKRITILLMGFFLIFSSSAQAETKYVVEHTQVTVRTGASLNHKIISMLESGQKVQVLESGREWSLVKLENGREGWMLSRFLTNSEPRSLVLERLQKQYDELTDQVKVLSGENIILKEENQILKTELSTHKEALEQITMEYEELKKNSSEYLELKEREQEAVSKLQEVTSKAQTMESEISRLRNRQNIQWFLVGSGVLFIGFLAGSISRRKRRQSSLF